MIKKIISIIVFPTLGTSIIFGQEISNETLKAIYNADTIQSNKIALKENLNKCFELKQGSYNYL